MSVHLKCTGSHRWSNWIKRLWCLHKRMMSYHSSCRPEDSTCSITRKHPRDHSKWVNLTNQSSIPRTFAYVIDTSHFGREVCWGLGPLQCAIDVQIPRASWGSRVTPRKRPHHVCPDSWTYIYIYNYNSCRKIKNIVTTIFLFVKLWKNQLSTIFEGFHFVCAWVFCGTVFIARG